MNSAHTGSTPEAAPAVRKVGAAIVPDSEGRILIGRRAPHKPVPGLWEFPGGKLEEGEDIPSCIRRELIEELDLTVDPIAEIAVSEAVRTERQDAPELHFWLCRPVETRELPLRDHDAIRWVRLEELKDYDIVPGSRPMAEDLVAGRYELSRYMAGEESGSKTYNKEL